MSAILYLNAAGHAVTRHSFSAGSEYRECPRKYQLKRILGWREKKSGASLEFGNAVEAAIQFFHANKLKADSGVDEFKRLWAKQKDNKALTYTDREDSWESMYLMGSQMLKLYEVRLPAFGYTDAKFQLNYRKEVFPGSNLAGIEHTAYIDMHVQLNGEPALIDIKTMGASLNETPGIIMLDRQLCEYAWTSGVPTVGFLWFTKGSTSGEFKRGDKVAVLTGEKAGAELRVLLPNEEGRVSVLAPDVFEDFEKDADGLKGKALDVKKHEWANKGLVYNPDELTKQKLQFVTVKIPEAYVREVGELVGQDIVEIVNSNEKNSYPKNGGVRFPNAKCTYCAMRGICTGNDALRDELLESPGGDDWITELERA